MVDSKHTKRYFILRNKVFYKYQFEEVPIQHVIFNDKSNPYPHYIDGLSHMFTCFTVEQVLHYKITNKITYEVIPLDEQ